MTDHLLWGRLQAEKGHPSRASTEATDKEGHTGSLGPWGKSISWCGAERHEEVTPSITRTFQGLVPRR